MPCCLLQRPEETTAGREEKQKTREFLVVAKRRPLGDVLNGPPQMDDPPAAAHVAGFPRPDIPRIPSHVARRPACRCFLDLTTTDSVYTDCIVIPIDCFLKISTIE